MSRVILLVLMAAVAAAQSGTASVSGTIVDGKTKEPVTVALVTASCAGAPPFSKNTKSGGDGAFQIPGLTAGAYSLCVQAPGDRYLDPCQWNGAPVVVTLTPGQNVVGLSLKLTAASVLNIQVVDPQKVFSQPTKDGRRPDLTLGVWGPRGIYYPAHPSSALPSISAPEAGVSTYTYSIGVPRDTALNLYIASHDLKLADSTGVSLPANASRQAFLHASDDPKPKSFGFTVLGVLP